MKNVALKEIEKELNWRERIIARLFKKTFIKIYGLAGKNMFNNINDI